MMAWITGTTQVTVSLVTLRKMSRLSKWAQYLDKLAQLILVVVCIQHLIQQLKMNIWL